MKIENCKRGQIWLVNFNPSRGSEQRGIRPALIVQNDIGNRYSSTTIVAAITTTIREFPVTVILEPGEGVLKKHSMVNLAQILTIDKSRLLENLGSLKEGTVDKVDKALAVSLDLYV